MTQLYQCIKQASIKYMDVDPREMRAFILKCNKTLDMQGIMMEIVDHFVDETATKVGAVRCDEDDYINMVLDLETIPFKLMVLFYTFLLFHANSVAVDRQRLGH